MIDRTIFNSDSPFLSVVIPVYNAEKFIKRAVESALSQPETAEVILVEDGSEDDSYEACQSLSEKHEKVYLYAHRGHINKGAGATRNLGIQKAHFDYIAFLDADDFYLKDRFKEAKKVLHSTPDADGVYEAIGVHFDSESAKEKWLKNNSGRSLTTIEDGIRPEDFFWSQSPIGSKGYTSLDGLTVKKSALLKVGMFDPDLRLHQDREIYLRLAIACSLYPGQVNSPVAKRGVHSNNRISKVRPIEETIENFRKMLNSTYKWTLKKGYTAEAEELKTKLTYSRIMKANGGDYNDSLKNLDQYINTLKEAPSVIFEISFYKYLFKFLLRYLWNKTKKGNN